MSKKGVTENFPFDANTLVFKVCGKIFALTNIEEFTGINLKCDPEEAIALREKYDCVLPGYHMNKKHWNTVVMDGSVRDELILAWIDHSYERVIEGLSRKEKLNLENMSGAHKRE
jgi:predicted DNA-binding protein (MmcQ/YjbR family)